jgi:hypothetical protein
LAHCVHAKHKLLELCLNPWKFDGIPLPDLWDECLSGTDLLNLLSFLSFFECLLVFLLSLCLSGKVVEIFNSLSEAADREAGLVNHRNRKVRAKTGHLPVVHLRVPDYFRNVLVLELFENLVGCFTFEI